MTGDEMCCGLRLMPRVMRSAARARVGWAIMRPLGAKCMRREADGIGRCEDCRICSPSPLDRLLLLNLFCLVSLRLFLSGEPAETRCPICGHPLRYHKRRPAV